MEFQVTKSRFMKSVVTYNIGTIKSAYNSDVISCIDCYKLEIHTSVYQ